MRDGCNHPHHEQRSSAHAVPALDRWFIHDRFPLTPIHARGHTRQSLSSTLQGVCVTPSPSARQQPDAGAYPSIAPKRKIFRRVLYSFGLLLVGFVLTVWLDGLLTRLPGLAGTPARGERVGVIHVHTNASCGSGSLSQVIAAAKRADLSFLAITDHNGALSDAEVAAVDPPEFAVIDGEEVSTTSGHFLALGVSGNRWDRGTSFDARSLMASTRKAGAVNFIAHP